MEFFLGRGVGKRVLGFLKGAKREILVISPWIGKEEAENLKELSKRVKVRVFTGKENNPGLDILSRKRVRLLALLWIVGIVGMSLYLSLGDPRFLLLLILVVPAVPFLRRDELLPWVKTLEDLHAKVYIIDDVVLLSSANLTRSGMRRNVEFLLILEDGESEEIRRKIVEAVRRW